jgi:nicotianamine synthase
MNDSRATSTSATGSSHPHPGHLAGAVLTTAASPVPHLRPGGARSRAEVRVALPRPAAAEVRHLYEALAEQPSLAPGPLVDDLFGRLVELTVALGSAEATTMLADPEVQAIRPRLQRLCATGETELEREWAGRITASADPAAELGRFPYLENYRLLVDLEWSAVLGASGRRPPRRVAFVGAGPLPLSSLLLARDHHVAVDSFDRDRGAVARARGVLAALGEDGRRVRAGNTARCPDLRSYDLVVLAALVGSTPTAKRAAIAQVHARMRPGALLAARSAHAARSLLYPDLDLEAFGELELLSVVHPFNQVINSIVLARKWAPDHQHRRATSPAPNDEVRPWPDS